MTAHWHPAVSFPHSLHACFERWSAVRPRTIAGLRLRKRVLESLPRDALARAIAPTILVSEKPETP